MLCPTSHSPLSSFIIHVTPSLCCPCPTFCIKLTYSLEYVYVTVHVMFTATFFCPVTSVIWSLYFSKGLINPPCLQCQPVHENLANWKQIHDPPPHTHTKEKLWSDAASLNLNLWAAAAGFLTPPIILKKSGSSPSVRGPSALLSARLFSFRAPLLLTACQATSGNVKESVFQARDSRSITSVYYIRTPFSDPDPCPLSLSPAFFFFFLRGGTLISVRFVSGLCSLFVYFLVKLNVCLTVVKSSESMALNILQIPLKFKCELCVCVVVFGRMKCIDLHLHTWQSRQAGRSPLPPPSNTQYSLWKINWYLA